MKKNVSDYLGSSNLFPDSADIDDSPFNESPNIDNLPFNKPNKTEVKKMENPYIEVPALSVQEMNFNDKETGDRRKMWRVYAADPSGAVGSIYSSTQVFPGELIRLSLAVSKEGKFTAKIAK